MTLAGSEQMQSGIVNQLSGDLGATSASAFTSMTSSPWFPHL